MERNDRLIKRKLYSYMIPSIVMIAALQLGNLVDGIIVGNLLGSYGLTAISLAVPIVYFLQLPSILFGVGGATSATVCMGKRDMKNASSVYTFSMTANAVCSVLLSVIILLSRNSLAEKLSGGGELFEMVKSIITIYGFGMPLVCFVNAIAYFMNVDNNPNKMAAMHITANVINLVLDYVLVRSTSLGIAGSSLSTVLGYCLSGAVFVPLYVRDKNRILSFSMKGAFDDKQLIAESVKNGLPSVSLLAMTAAGAAAMNTGIVNILGQKMMAVYSAAENSFMIVQLCLDGIVGVIATIAGVLYGEKDYFGIRHLIKRITLISMSVCAVIIALFMILPQIVGLMFGFNFEENFNYSFTCDSITDFWRRQHISLSKWFRDYVYIPLGGSRVSKPRWVWNLFVVWLLTGIWHGANWTFWICGLYYFVLLVFEKFTRFPSQLTGAARPLRHVYALILTAVGLVIFRAESIPHTARYIGNMFGVGASGLTDNLFPYYIANGSVNSYVGQALLLLALSYFFNRRIESRERKASLLLACVLFSLPVLPWLRNLFETGRLSKYRGAVVCYDLARSAAMLTLLAVCIVVCAKSAYNPFIYYHF